MKKQLAYGILIWLAMFFIVSGLSSLIHGTSAVFLLGGSTNTFLSIIITFIIFGSSFFIMSRLSRDVSHVTQFITIIIAYFIVYIFLLRGFMGFFPWDIEIMLSPSMKAGISVKIILVLVAAIIGSYIGTRLGNRKPSR